MRKNLKCRSIKLGVHSVRTSFRKTCKITDVEQKILFVVVMPKMKCVKLWILKKGS